MKRACEEMGSPLPSGSVLVCSAEEERPPRTESPRPPRPPFSVHSAPSSFTASSGPSTSRMRSCGGRCKGPRQSCARPPTCINPPIHLLSIHPLPILPLPTHLSLSTLSMRSSGGRCRGPRRSCARPPTCITASSPLSSCYPCYSHTIRIAASHPPSLSRLIRPNPQPQPRLQTYVRRPHSSLATTRTPHHAPATCVLPPSHPHAHLRLTTPPCTPTRTVDPTRKPVRASPSPAPTTISAKPHRLSSPAPSLTAPPTTLLAPPHSTRIISPHPPAHPTPAAGVAAATTFRGTATLPTLRLHTSLPATPPPALF